MTYGCNLFNSDNLVSESRIAEDGIELHFQEFYKDEEGRNSSSSVDPELFLVMTTNEIMPCMNYQIDYNSDYNSANSKIRKIDLQGISLPGFMCLTALGPAVSEISYEEAPLETELEIKDGELVDRYDVHITEEYVDIRKMKGSFTTLNGNRFYLKPENSFYFICGTLQTKSELCGEFDSLLRDESGISEFQFPEDGIIPYPSMSQGNQFNASATYYIYDSIEDFESAGQLLEQFTKERIGRTDGNSLSITNWRNEGYRSWSFQNQ